MNGILVDIPLIKATQQFLHFQSIAVDVFNGNVVSRINFTVLNQDGAAVDTKSIMFQGGEHNVFIQALFSGDITGIIELVRNTLGIPEDKVIAPTQKEVIDMLTNKSAEL